MRSRTIPTLVLGLAALWSTSAHASEVFPGVLQEAADMDCVPVCTMCHLGTPSLTTWSQPLGVALRGRGLKQRDTDSLRAAYAAYAADPTTTAAALTNIKAGKDPLTGADVCGPTYGCGAHIAKEAAAPREFTGPLWIVGAVVVGGLLRRRRKPHAG